MVAPVVLMLCLSACGGGTDYTEAELAGSAVEEASTVLDLSEAARTPKPVDVSASAADAAAGTRTGASTTTSPTAATRTTTTATSTTATPTTATPTTAPAPAPVTTVSTASLHEVAIRDMRAADGSYARNDDRLLHRSMVSPSSQTERASLTMGRYGTSAAFTNVNPDYQTELSWVSMSDPARWLPAWTRMNFWDQLYLSERYGPNHAPGYTGNTRVKTWGYELWIKNKAGTWRRVFKTDNKSAEAWRPSFRGSASFDSSALDLRKEPDGSTSVRTLPALGFDSSGTYWVPHGYAGGLQLVDPYDIADVLVRCFSQLVLHDSSKTDDRQSARFLLGIGADWYPPEGRMTVYPGVGTSKHKYVTVAPQMHVMHTMTEAEYRANPPPLQ